MSTYTDRIYLDLGDLHVTSFDPLDKDFDLLAQFKGIKEHILTAPDGDINQAAQTALGAMEAFKLTYKTDENFLTLSTEQRLNALDATQHSMMSFAKTELYNSVNGIALFQCWLVAMIRNDVDCSDLIKIKITAFIDEYMKQDNTNE